MLGVFTEPTTDIGGGLNVGWIDKGDWMAYDNSPVNIPQKGTYTIEFRVASKGGGGVLSFEEAGGLPNYGYVSIGDTGGWQKWVTVKLTTTLEPGIHRFGLKAQQGNFNINKFSITLGAK
jgi:endoglucanase